MTCAQQNFTIYKGKTFSKLLRWETAPLVYKAIVGITQAAPVAIEATGHGLPDGWRVAVVSAQGMREINAKTPGKGEPPFSSEFHKATVVGDDDITINDINSLDFTAHVANTGVLVYYTPESLSGFTARMQIRATKESTTVLLELTTENDRITIDNTAKTIALLIDAVDTAALDFTEGVYDLELVSGATPAVVTKLLEGSIAVEEEVTR